MSELRNKIIFVRCPRCDGHKGIYGRSDGPYKGAPATLPCDRCDSTGEVDQATLTEIEKYPPQKVMYERDL